MAHIRKARSGQGWEARYRDPHGEERSRTFRTKRDAQQFVARAESDLQRGDWLDPRVGRIRFEQWAQEWLATSVHLKPRTRYGYERLLLADSVDEHGGVTEHGDGRRAWTGPGCHDAVITSLSCR